MSDTWQAPIADSSLDLAVQQLQDSMARPIAELQGLIGRLRAEQESLTDFIVFKNDATTNGAIETTARSLTDKMLLRGLLLVTDPGATAVTLQLGELVIPVQNTTFTLDNLSRVVQPQDRIRVTQAPDGDVFLWLWGSVIPVASL